MSATQRAAGVAPARRALPRPEESRRAPLAAVEAGAATAPRASSSAFALFVAAILGLGLLGLLGLNTLLAQGAFTTSDLSRKQARLEIAAQALQREVAVLESPQVLSASAAKLGMVGTKNPVFLDPATGRILGVPLAGARPYVAPPKVAGAPTTLGGVTAPTTGAATTKPGITKPGITKPGTTKPGTTKPGTTKPGGTTATTGPTRPGSSQ